MEKKANAIICALCTIFAVIIFTNTSNVNNASASEKASTGISYISEMVNSNNGRILLVGDEGDATIPTDFSVSEYVKATKAELITSDIYSRNNVEMEVSEKTRMEFVNQFINAGPQTITVHEDVITSETKIILERLDSSGKVHYVMYTFDHIHWPWEEEEANDDVLTFEYKGFRYKIFVQNDKFCLTKIYWPESKTNIYDCNELMSEKTALIKKIQQAFTEGKNITFIEELDYYVRIHAFVDNGSQKEEYIFYTYNARPFDENSQIIASVDTVDDTYTIYESGDFICLDSARRAGWADNPYGTRVG